MVAKTLFSKKFFAALMTSIFLLNWLS